MKILIDVMSGDNAPLEIIKGAEMASREFDEEIIIIGDENGIVSFGEEYVDEIAEMVSIKLNNEHLAMKRIDEDIEGYKRRRSNRVSQWMNESGYKWLFDRSDFVE